MRGLMHNPTGGKIRNDPMGSGYYGTPRGNRKHKGLDHNCIPGQPYVAEIDCYIPREARPYPDEEYSGLIFEGKRITLMSFYFKPLAGIIGKHVKAGEQVGNCQDITKRKGKNYDKRGMTPHTHTEIVSCDPMIFYELP